ncbi:MAG: DUF3105 domain-containing protein [Patescibacteria group bacterium]
MEEDNQDLTRREKRKLYKEEKREEEKSKIKFNLTRFLIIFLLLAGAAGVGYWLYHEATKPLSGELIADLGREHVPDGTQVNYNSNPPTSGSHYGDWTRAGVYGQPISDGHLVHSLEHGYVVISYNCMKSISNYQFLISNVLAHEEDLNTTSSGQSSSPSAELTTDTWKSDNCQDLVNKLTSIFAKKGKRKLIVIPRPNLDTAMALTAWRRVDKFDKFDEKRITNFIDSFRDQGPEKTLE